MNWVAPIKDDTTLEKFKQKLREVDDKYYILFEIGVGTGMQLQEILKFRNKDIRGKDSIEASIGTKNIKRTFQIPEELKTIIEQYTEGKDPDAYLSDYRNRNNVRMQEVKEAIGVESRTTIFNPTYIKEKMKGEAGAANTFAEIVQNTYGWNVMKPKAIDKEMWERVQTLLIRNNNSRIRRHDYILSGLLRCYECKSAIGISKKDNRGYSYGRCQRYVKYSKFKVCTPHSFNYQKLEKRVVSLLKKICEIYTDKSNLEAIAQSGNKVNMESVLRKKIDYYENMVEKNNRRLDRLYEDRLDGVITVEDFKRMSEKIKDERDNFNQTKVEYEKKLEEYKEKIKNEDLDL